MSLITNALKQAQKTTDQQPGQTPPPITPRARFVDVPQESNQPPRSRSPVILIIVLVVVAGAVVAQNWLFKQPPHKQMPAHSAAKAERGSASEDSETNAAETASLPASKSAKTAQPDGTENPRATHVSETAKTEQVSTAPVPPPEPPKFTLQGVMIDGQDREAVINGVSYRVGDNIEGARVTAIDTRSVRLQFGGHEIELRLP